jgi:hypothetical protein
MQCTFEDPKTRKRGSGLNNLDMVMKVLRQTVACSSDDGITTFSMCPDMVGLRTNFQMTIITIVNKFFSQYRAAFPQHLQKH